MAKTLRDVPAQYMAKQPEQSQLTRLITNIFRCSGLFSSYDTAVASRIYMAYVIGWLRAAVKFSWRNVDLESL